MKKEELFSLLTSAGISPSKKMGQNFLIDNNLLDFIVRIAAPLKNQYIVEIGPGFGCLTDRLIAKETKLTLIEYDAKIASYLKKKYESTITLIHQDACKVDFDKLSESCPSFSVVSNLPYSISTPLLAKITEMKNPPEKLVLLLQKETAMRFTSKPKTKEYGSISVRIQTVFDTEYIRDVTPGVFYPKPEVTSGIVKFTKKQKFPAMETREKLNSLVKIAFLKRRKKLINTIKNIMPENLGEIFQNLNISLNARPEELSPETYLALSDFVAKSCTSSGLEKQG